MRQQFRLDPSTTLAYLALGIAACHPAAVELVPPGTPSVGTEQVKAWVDATTPKQGVLHRFKWQYRDEKGAAGGRGSVRLAAPDSLRFDAAGPLGTGRSSAVVVGDSAIWFDPEDRNLADLVPDMPLMWALFGVARPPNPSASLHGLEERDQISWQYTRDADTVEYRRVTGHSPTFLAEIRRAGKVVGRAEASFAADGTPVKARLVVPGVPARLDLTFYSSKATTAFPPDTWLRHRP